MNCLWITVILGSVALTASEIFDDHWVQYKAKHGKEYESPEEDQRRKAHFVNHVQNVMEHNAKFDMGLVTYEKTVDHPHADKSFEEFKATLLADLPSYDNALNRTDFSKIVTTRAAPRTQVRAQWWHMDWNGSSKRVTSVKDQGGCGSCWSFSLVGALEGQFYTCNKQTRELSPQYLVDCLMKGQYGCWGCGGGSPISAMRFVQDNHGIPLESYYKYQGKEVSCPKVSASDLYMPISETVVVGPEGDEKAMLNAVNSGGPVSVGIHVNEDLMNYKSGIFESSNCPPDQRNHAVLVTGYGDYDNEFWIVKNSWGPNWGDKGYIRMKRNKNNMCGIASTVAYPKVDCSKVK